ncbi:MAG TPA: glycoside hydrolase family 2 TIM barrel-domain containing protein [Vicinamibacterales bacterium]|nr:glycoside hydrolase family 2 TIM barrel-domain containing protein [Vicinamibacterales bacterium]
MSYPWRRIIGLAVALPVATASQPRPAAQPASAAQPRLLTKWAADVKPDAVLPEYPRPHMRRESWQNLNGHWDYALTARGAARPDTYEGRILVPFAIESFLSGVQRPMTPGQHLWYRRTFEMARPATGRRVLLHFGAVDWEAVVWVNGRQVGEHRGGYDPFAFDVTDALADGARQELVVRVWDPTDKGPQPRGKQVLEPRTIWYTAVTGIWQTVWLETVPAAHISALRIDPDLDAGVVRVRVSGAGTPADTTARVEALEGTSAVGSASGPLDKPIELRVPNARQWSPGDPFLYDLTVRLSTGDSVRSYFGMRKISIGRDANGITRLLLNGTALFQFGQLDQGWWPDGLYTAPTSEALRFDIEAQKKMGYNAIRKHVKIEPARWYYECDRLGMLVWQDMPSGDNNTPEGIAGFQRELAAMVSALRHHPSIVMWVPFNEGWGQHETAKYVSWLAGEDPTRLVNNASGWTDQNVGHVIDLHAYPGPAGAPLEPDRAMVIGEFGGLGLPLEGHTWLPKGNWGYRSYTSADALGAAYRDLLAQLRLQIGFGAAAAIYTQTTDVEIEVNGLMTYDRAMTKLPVAELAKWHAALYTPPSRVVTVAPTADSQAVSWRYTTSQPAEGWTAPAFDASAWKEGPSGFGQAQTRWGRVGTEWKTTDLWLRRTVDLAPAQLTSPHLKIFHDDGVEVYLNGDLLLERPGATGGYIFLPLDDAARKSLRAGANTLAVHVRQERGGQYIDVGIVDVK